MQQAINRDPTGPVARRYARSARFTRNGDDAARKALWRELPPSVRTVAARLSSAGGWSWPEKVGAAVALAAYVQGNGRAWRDWLTGARAKGVAGVVNADDVAELQ